MRHMDYTPWVTIWPAFNRSHCCRRSSLGASMGSLGWPNFWMLGETSVRRGLEASGGKFKIVYSGDEIQKK